MSIKGAGEQMGAAIELANALDEWKNAGGDSLTVVAAIQNFMYLIVDDTAGSGQASE